MSSAVGHTKWYRWFLPIFVGVFVLVAATGTVSLVLVPTGRNRLEYVVVSMLSFGLFGLTSVACVFNWVRGSWRVAALAGLVCSILSLPLFLAGIWRWGGWQHLQTIEDLMGLGATWSILLPVLGLLGLARLHRRWLWTQSWTQTMASVTALFITWLILEDPHSDDWFRLLGALVILTGCGVICVPVLHWINSLQAPDKVITTPLVLTLVCPRCGELQQLSAGSSRCAKCGLGLRIEIEEEHCPTCGYSLYKLTSAQCPECGTPVLGLIEHPGKSQASAENTHAE